MADFAWHILWWWAMSMAAGYPLIEIRDAYLFDFILMGLDGGGLCSLT